MTLEQIVALILGIGTLLPLLTAVVQQKHWSSRTRSIIGVVMSVLAGLVAWVSTHGLNVSDLPGLIATVVGIALASIAAYNGIWKPTGVANAIEVATSPTPAVAVPTPEPAAAEPTPTVTANADGTVTSVAADGTQTLS